MNKKKATSSLYHDTRRAKIGTKLYPVKLKVTFNRKAKYYPTGIDLSTKDYASLKESKRIKDELTQIRKDLEKKKANVEETIDDLQFFSFDLFEAAYYGLVVKNKKDVISVYQEMMKRKDISISTRDSYQNSLNSILAFRIHQELDYEDCLPFAEVTTEFIHEWERFMLEPRTSKTENGKTKTTPGRSKSTVGIYARALRAVFNYAIIKNYITKEIYPFGPSNYVPPSKKNVKKILTNEEIKRLVSENLDALSPQKKARDFFILSYLWNGINIGDILSMKNSQIQKDGFIYYRIKTKNIRKEAASPIQVTFASSWQDYVWSIIESNRNEDRNSEAYLFPIYTIEMDETTRHRVKRNFIRFINQHLLILCKKIGIDKPISTYYARHTFASMLMHSDAPINEIKDRLGHTEIGTTQGYLHSLGSKKTLNALENLL